MTLAAEKWRVHRDVLGWVAIDPDCDTGLRDRCQWFETWPDAVAYAREAATANAMVPGKGKNKEDDE